MKKLILLFSIIMLFQTMVCGETIPPRGVPMTKETHPIHWSYFENYTKRLEQALKYNKKYRKINRGASYEYIITKEGEIKDIKDTGLRTDKFIDNIKDVILSVKPEPFYEGMESEDILFDTFLGYYKYNEIDISVGYSVKNRKIIHLTVCLKKNFFNRYK